MKKWGKKEGKKKVREEWKMKGKKEGMQETLSSIQVKDVKTGKEGKKVGGRKHIQGFLSYLLYFT